MASQHSERLMLQKFSAVRSAHLARFLGKFYDITIRRPDQRIAGSSLTLLNALARSRWPSLLYFSLLKWSYLCTRAPKLQLWCTDSGTFTGLSSAIHP